MVSTLCGSSSPPRDEHVEQELHELRRVGLDDGADRARVRGERRVLRGREVLVRGVVERVVSDDGADGVECVEDDADGGEREGRQGRLERGGEGGREEDVVRHRVGERLDEVHVVVEDWRRPQGSVTRLRGLARTRGRSGDAPSGTCVGGVACSSSNSLLLSRSNAALAPALNPASPWAANCCTSLPVIHR